jgi:hypothetical protein
VKVWEAHESFGVEGGYAIIMHSKVGKLDHEGIDSHDSKRRKLVTRLSSQNEIDETVQNTPECLAEQWKTNCDVKILDIC